MTTTKAKAKTKTIAIKGFGPAGNQTLRSAYLFVYDNFSADTREVAKYLGISTEGAHAILSAMEGRMLCGDLISDGKGSLTDFNTKSRKANPGQARIWQCWTTYDSENRDAAEARIDAWLIENGYAVAA